jgi:uncharacterized membrane protein
MEVFIDSIESYFECFVRIVILLLEVFGVLILLGSALRAVFNVLRKDEHTRLRLAEGISLALEFKLGSEVLRSVLVRSLDELIVLGCIVLLRAALTFLLFWEIKKEKEAIASKYEMNG